MLSGEVKREAMEKENKPLPCKRAGYAGRHTYTGANEF